ncbi:glycosyltransferase [Algoriphagus sp. C2-6-M1]|uniref:glycosyltransferase n=1 Tax=Algoriphagus persicinus TaxID=3108754 RepID=UPI002B3D8C43|nr:glycosyltransferase [Algoriphagus sp. C2-6-M1]MEB2782431.1 glycosyltransferase [Algoriphagus sp. C2-6-M1]
MRFSAFLITYERTIYINDTISSILSQSLVPIKILVLDNSFSKGIMNALLEPSKIDYCRIGKNLGPAGAAKIGLEKLTDEGFDWIYWGDDDDPPSDPKTFERLLEIASQNPTAGIIGKVGGRFIPSRARTRVFSNNELKPITEADYVTGGKQMIVSARLVKAGVLPNPELFFGFEELDFCLRAKDAGFSVLIDGAGILQARNQRGNTNPDYRWKGKSYGRTDQLNRQYYSLRNLLFILSSRREWIGYVFLLTKTLLKMLVSFRYGFQYGSKFSKSQFLALSHERSGRMGQYVVFP